MRIIKLIAIEYIENLHFLICKSERQYWDVLPFRAIFSIFIKFNGCLEHWNRHREQLRNWEGVLEKDLAEEWQTGLFGKWDYSILLLNEELYTIIKLANLFLLIELWPYSSFAEFLPVFVLKTHFLPWQAGKTVWK